MTRKPNFPDDVFRRELEGSYHWLDEVAKSLSVAGISTIQAERRFRADVTEIDQFTRTEKDLVLPLSQMSIEVKGRNESWTSPANFPYPTIIVDTVSGFDAKVSKPIAYINISMVTGIISVIPVLKVRNWSKEQRWDRKRKIRDWFYETDARQMLGLDWLVAICTALEALPSADARQSFLLANGFDT